MGWKSQGSIYPPISDTAFFVFAVFAHGLYISFQWVPEWKGEVAEHDGMEEPPRTKAAWF